MEALKTAFRSLAELTLNLADLDSGDEQEAILTALKQAQCEQAMHELRHDVESQAAETVSLAGLVSVKFPDGKPPPRSSSRALAVLRPYLYVPTVNRTR